MEPTIDASIFKAYDIRGVYPTQINADLVYKIAQAYIQLIKPKSIVLGHDMRLSGQEFAEAAARALTDAGVDVIDVGLVSTDQLYFAAATLPVDGGIQITASHNPKEFGGMKLVREKGRPVSGDSGIYQIRDWVLSGKCLPAGEAGKVPACRRGGERGKRGVVTSQDIRSEYFDHVFKTFDVKKIKPFKIVANTNFGMATQAIAELTKRLPIEFIEIVNPNLDGTFPKGASDPLLPSNRGETIEAIKKLKPDLGVAWDGDADRCFFFDELGNFVTPAYASALFAQYYLQKNPGAKILHDTRVVRVIDDAVERGGGVIVMNKAGHSFIKERMVKDDVVFGCETSGHYYFKDNFYLDNGLFPFVAMLEILSASARIISEGPSRDGSAAGSPSPHEGRGRGEVVSFSELLRPLREKFYISEEINFEFQNKNILEDIKAQYHDATIDNVDGYDFNYPDWRFNLRTSNTQNLLRLNLEANSAELLKQKTDEVTSFIEKVK